MTATNLQFTEIPLTNWASIETAFNDLLSDGEGVWNYRGQAHADWPLASSLERVFNDYGIGPEDRLKREEILTKEFKRYYHLYSAFVPDTKDTLTYLTLMRHYGAPTRLLDFTYSFYVALFFAVVDMAMDEADTGCALFALNRRNLNSRIQSLLGEGCPHFTDRHFEKPETFQTWFLVPESKMMVYPLNAYRLNERSAIQQGYFLCLGDIRRSFEANLQATLTTELETSLRKYTIKADWRLKRDILYRLHKMNISQATLFPGLEGFSQSLKSRVWMYEVN